MIKSLEANERQTRTSFSIVSFTRSSNCGFSCRASIVLSALSFSHFNDDCQCMNSLSHLQPPQFNEVIYIQNKDSTIINFYGYLIQSTCIYIYIYIYFNGVCRCFPYINYHLLFTKDYNSCWWIVFVSY